MLRIVHHRDYLVAAPAGSRYRWGKNGLVRNLLADIDRPIEWIVPAAIERRWVEAVHNPEYVAEVAAARVPAAKERRIGFAVTPAVARRAFVVPGGTWLAGRVALDHGFAFNIAGGSHHALAETGAGFCVFNDLAIAANRLVAEESVTRIAIVDVDVHQGDGTASLTAGIPGIVTYSIHAAKNFPARKAVSTLDVPLADGTGDADYLAMLEATLDPFLDAHAPDLILYQAGVDPFAGDRLGRLSLTGEGLVARERLVARLATARGIPLAATLGGGYGADLMEVARRHVDTLFALGEAMLGGSPAFSPLGWADAGRRASAGRRE